MNIYAICFSSLTVALLLIHKTLKPSFNIHHTPSSQWNTIAADIPYSTTAYAHTTPSAPRRVSIRQRLGNAARWIARGVPSALPNRSAIAALARNAMHAALHAALLSAASATIGQDTFQFDIRHFILTSIYIFFTPSTPAPPGPTPTITTHATSVNAASSTCTFFEAPTISHETPIQQPPRTYLPPRNASTPHATLNQAPPQSMRCQSCP
ncbi:hypothetical protein LshimejAT787_0211680 [Lyophyllum shimeji]|uniref:Uncharacterized protein n=1 Tax=Lyophyllum shimeji TaxID=47721 RepID=A0A9P3UJE1_LYOSH|nr:hypothetical protein LshimejAT787_0211680 [Lyophyllum shimeji]